MTDDYSSTQKTFRYQPEYTVTPSICAAEIICDSVTQQPAGVTILPAKLQCQDFAANQISWTFTDSDH